MKRIVVLPLLFIAASFLTAAPKIIISNAISVHSIPKYKEGFTHFEYVNPDAPKGGTLRMGALDSFDNLNRYSVRGNYAAGSESFYDTLMTASEDEQEVYYGLIAEKVEYPEDSSWIIFHINPRARFQDGAPITADDVVFTFNKFMTEGVPQFKLYYADITVQALDKLRVKFTLKKGDKALLVSLGGLSILPPQYWKAHKLSDPLTEPPLGSGAYVLKDYKMGQYLVYERMKSYWGMDLPVNKGQLNFDFLRYDYFKDEVVSFEAFKAGVYDFYQENSAKNWATLYKGRNFDNGAIVKETLPGQQAAGDAGPGVQHVEARLQGQARPPGAGLCDGLRVDEQEPVLRPVHPQPQLLRRHGVRGRRPSHRPGAHGAAEAAREDPGRGLYQGVQPAGDGRDREHQGPGP